MLIRIIFVVFILLTTNISKAEILFEDNYDNAPVGWVCSDGAFGDIDSIDTPCSSRTVSPYGTRTNLELGSGKQGYGLSQYRINGPYINSIVKDSGSDYILITTNGPHFLNLSDNTNIIGTTNYNSIYPSYAMVLSVVDEDTVKIDKEWTIDENPTNAQINMFNTGYAGYPHYVFSNTQNITSVNIRVYLRIDPSFSWSAPSSGTLKQTRFYYCRSSDRVTKHDIRVDWTGTSSSNAIFKITDPLGGLSLYSPTLTWEAVNDGVFHSIELQLTLPTWTDGVKNSDGIVRLWLDGTEQRLCIPYGACSDTGFSDVTLNNSSIFSDTILSDVWTPMLENISDGYWTSSTNDWVYYSIDNYVVSTEYIGPYYGITTGASKISGSGTHSISGSGQAKFQ